MTRSATFTAAAEQLAGWVERDGNSQGTLARALGVSQPAVSQWIRGTARPETHLREAIELLTGISAGLWETEAERELVERVRAQVGAEVERPPSVPPPARKTATARTRAAVAKVAKAGDVAPPLTGTGGR